MKAFSKVLGLFVILILAYHYSCAAPIEIGTAKKVAAYQIAHNGKSTDYLIKDIGENVIDSKSLFYIAELSPKGYIIITADDNLPPVIAYSFDNNINLDGKFISLLEKDIKLRLAAIDKLPEAMILQRKLMWKKMLSDDFSRDTQLESWPPEGSTTTGGWMEFSWNQGAPYWDMCPIDPVSSGRSYTGCPATAIAMILNFHQTTNNLQFTDDDDYYHSYAGRNYWIDNDSDANGFPSFTDLNKYLDTVNMHWQEHVPPTNNDKAALSFACGIAATQVYTSEGSGTFEVAQAYDAYLRIGCSSSILLIGHDPLVFPTLIQNMKDTLPAHLAIVDEAWSSGHNVVVDGYNSENYFHVNFGWGGSNNGWYLLPDEMPYSLTVVEGVVVDILKNPDISNVPTITNRELHIFPNPAKSDICISTPADFSGKECDIEIFNISGQLVHKTSATSSENYIKTSDIGIPGTYFIKLTRKDNLEFKSCKIIIE
jgi:hypothetical protein